MIADHNIKVNGRWIHAGEEYTVEKPEAPKKEEAPVTEPEVPEVKAPEEEPEEKAEAKPKSTSRRKKISE